jgi:hypothetical protein
MVLTLDAGFALRVGGGPDDDGDVERRMADCVERQWHEMLDCAARGDGLLESSAAFDAMGESAQGRGHEDVSSARQVRALLLEAQAVDVRVGAVTERRDVCAAVLFCLLGRLSAGQVAGLATAPCADDGGRLARAVAEVYYMLDGRGDARARARACAGAGWTPWAPYDACGARAALGFAPCGAVRSDGPAQATKLAQAFAMGAVRAAGPAPAAANVCGAGDEDAACQSLWSYGASHPRPLLIPLDNSALARWGALHAAARRRAAEREAAGAADAQRLADAVQECWFVAHNSPQRVLAVLLGLGGGRAEEAATEAETAASVARMYAHDETSWYWEAARRTAARVPEMAAEDAKDAAFAAAAARNGGGRDLLRRITPQIRAGRPPRRAARHHEHRRHRTRDRTPAGLQQRRVD